MINVSKERHGSPVDAWIARGDWSKDSRAQLVRDHRDALWALFYCGLSPLVSDELWEELKLDAGEASLQLVDAFASRPDFHPTKEMKDHKTFTWGRYWLAWLVGNRAYSAAKGRAKSAILSRGKDTDAADDRRGMASSRPSPVNASETAELCERLVSTLQRLAVRACIGVCEFWLEATEDERDAYGILNVPTSPPKTRSKTESTAARAEARARFQILHEGMATAAPTIVTRAAYLHLFDRVPTTVPFVKDWRDVAKELDSNNRLEVLNAIRTGLTDIVNSLCDLAQMNDADSSFEQALRLRAPSLTLLHVYHLDRPELTWLKARAADIEKIERLV